MVTTDRLRPGWAALLVAAACLVGGALPAGAMTITKPARNETVTTNRLRLAGEASSRAKLRVLVQRRQRAVLFNDWRTIFDKRLQARSSGRWEASATAEGISGDYRVVVQRLDTRDKVIAEETSPFRVDLSSGPGEDDGRRELTITAPANGERLEEARARIAGTAPAHRDLRVRITHSPGETALTDTVRSNGDGRWSLTTNLPGPGSYLLEVMLMSGRDDVAARKFLTFFYAAGPNLGNQGDVRITRPERGEVVTVARFFIRGEARRGSDVRVRVFDSRDREVHVERTRIEAEGGWDVRPTLPYEGTFRAVAELLDPEGRVLARDTVTFRYDRR
jgi:hypothetical protein